MSEPVLKELDAVWIRLKAADGWARAQLGEVVAPGWEPGAKTVKVTINGNEVEVPRVQVDLACVGQETSEDIAELSSLNEPSLLELVRARYTSKDIYTRAGPVLVAVNPYADVSQQLYNSDVRDKYRAAAARTGDRGSASSGFGLPPSRTRAARARRRRGSGGPSPRRTGPRCAGTG